MSLSPEELLDRVCVIAGMPRASTTFLYHTLAKHPCGFVPSRKELEFFSLNSSRGRDWYLKFFHSMTQNQVAFDISPLYFFSANSAELIGRFFAKPKVILLIRDPVEFLISFYKNRLAAHDEKLEFDKFVSSYTYRKDNASLQLEFGPGVFESRISAFCRCLGDNLLLIDYNAIRTDSLEAMKVLETFCGLPAYFDRENFDNTYVNASDQANIRFINKLMHKKWFADLVTAVVPKRVTMSARYKLQTIARRGSPILSPEDEAVIRKASESAYAQDKRFIENLFVNAPFILGSGRTFPV